MGVPKCSRIEPLLVEAVADLVHDAEERVTEVVLVETGCDPAIARPDPGAKRMGGHVQPPAFEVKSDRRGDRLAKYPLAFPRINSFENRLAVSSARCVQPGDIPARAPAGVGDCGNKRDEVALESVEDRGEVTAFGPGLIFVEQGVVKSLVPDRPVHRGIGWPLSAR